MRGILTTLLLVVVVVVLILAAGVGISRVNFMAQLPVVGPLFEEQPERIETGTTVVEGIKDLNQLATVRYTSSVPITQSSGGNVLDRVFSGEEVLLIATGDVRAGVDLSKVGQDDVRVSEDSVTIRLPDPQVLSTSLNEDETRIYDRDMSPLNFRPDQDLAEEARSQAVDEIEATARENGILNQAQTNAEQSIRSFVTSLGFEEVNFE